MFYYQGHYFVEGVGYATIQAILENNLTGFALLLGLFVAKLFATTVSLGSGASGGIFSPSLFMGATLGAAFGGFVTMIGPVHGVDPVTCAIIGMAAMVGGGTGAAMTAVTMIFEMTRDYDIIMPIIVAVALAIGVRRLLSRENIYTIKLVTRGHVIPKALHANMFLVRHAEEVMDRDVLVLPAETDFAAFLRETSAGGFKHIVVTQRRPHRRRAARQYRVAARAGRRLFRRAARRHRAEEFHRRARRATSSSTWSTACGGAAPAWRSSPRASGRLPRGGNVVGMISKEHIADSVADSVRPYSSELVEPDKPE